MIHVNEEKYTKHDSISFIFRLYGNNITSKGAIVLFNTLCDLNAKIIKIDLSSNHLDDECTRPLAQYMKTSKSMEMLGIGYNNITDNGILNICDPSIDHSALKELDIQGSEGVTERSLPYITKMAQGPSATKLNLRFTSIPNEKRPSDIAISPKTRNHLSWQAIFMNSIVLLLFIKQLHEIYQESKRSVVDDFKLNAMVVNISQIYFSIFLVLNILYLFPKIVRFLLTFIVAILVGVPFTLFLGILISRLTTDLL